MITYPIRGISRLIYWVKMTLKDFQPICIFLCRPTIIQGIITNHSAINLAPSSWTWRRPAASSWETNILCEGLTIVNCNNALSFDEKVGLISDNAEVCEFGFTDFIYILLPVPVSPITIQVAIAPFFRYPDDNVLGTPTSHQRHTYFTPSKDTYAELHAAIKNKIKCTLG